MAFLRVWSSRLELMFAMGSVSVWFNCSLLNNLKKVEAGLTATSTSLFLERTWHSSFSGSSPSSRFLNNGTCWHFVLDSLLWGIILFIVACSIASLGSTRWMPVASHSQSWQSNTSPDAAKCPLGDKINVGRESLLCLFPPPGTLFLQRPISSKLSAALTHGGSPGHLKWCKYLLTPLYPLAVSTF